jgi:transketolase
MEARALSNLAINTIRTLSIDGVENAKSGHPGLPMGAAPMAYVLFQRHLRHDPADPRWPDRDRFVLSAGHGSMLLYSLLHLTGYDVSLDELKRFRQWDSKTPGHPECFMTPGVEATTGPLGQGSANAVGMAMAERFLAHRFNQDNHKIVDHYTYALVSDGDLMEGVAAEAGSLAGHLKLGKLIYLYDANDVTLDGPLHLSFSEDVGARYRSYGWHVQTVSAGDTDLDAIDKAITAAKAETEKPSLIIVKTTIGYGSPNKAGTAAAHGSPLGPAETELAKKQLGWEAKEPFFVPPVVAEHFRDAVRRGKEQSKNWQEKFRAFENAHPDLAKDWRLAWQRQLPSGWSDDLPTFAPGDKALATREAGGLVENAIAKKVPWLFGGDADLGCSTKTLISNGGSFEGQSGGGRNIHFGVREHAMGSICNGLDYHGGVRPFASTFFCFSDYMRPAVRIAALNKQPVVYVWTHDSIGLGEDGPTHQPVEHLMSLRAMPNLYVVRPADANETREAWKLAMSRTDGPTALVLSRQSVPHLEHKNLAGDFQKGAYILKDAARPAAILLATGSEVMLALAAEKLLADKGIATRVVSMPCWELFAAQPAAYREQVLPKSITARVSVEAGVTLGWERWVGDKGTAIGVDRFGGSAPAEVIYRELGLTPQHIADAVKRLVA